MGAAFSGGSLCRMVGGVEIVVSSVIIGFGSQALFLFYGMDDEFKEKYDRIQYSAITAVIQGSLTILASLMILFASRQKPGQPYLDDDASENGDVDHEVADSLRKPSIKSVSSLPHNQSYLATIQKIKRKLALIYRLWLSYSIISIGLLLVVFLCSMNYCVQTKVDKQRYDDKTDEGRNPFNLVDGKKIMIPPCYAELPKTIELRDALTNLYSYCLVNIFVLVVFMFVVYYQLKRVTRITHQPIKEDKIKVLPPPDKEDIEEHGGGAEKGQ